MSTTNSTSYQAIRSALNVLIEPGSTVELRIPQPKHGKPRVGYYRDLDAMAAMPNTGAGERKPSTSPRTR